MSLWLAANRAVGLPYLPSINALYIAAGLYFLLAMRRCGFPRWVLVVVFTIYLLNPVTLSEEWMRPLREPLSACLMVIFFGAMFFILQEMQERRLAVSHLVLLSVIFAFALLLREEEKLLYSALLLLAAAVIWTTWRDGRLHPAKGGLQVLLIVSLPLVFAVAANMATRTYISNHYGLPIVHDFAEGEFPRLIAAMRSVESSKDNRYVMITQEALSKLRMEASMLEPVISRLPPPSSDSYSCRRYGVCSEWANGWMLFWIKDAAFQAGLTPSLPAAQAFFRDARLDVEGACREGRLKCRDRGTGLLPPFELRWTRAYVQEWFTLLGMTLVPHIRLLETATLSQGIDANYKRVYEIVTRAAGFDTVTQTPGPRVEATAEISPAFSGWRRVVTEFYQSYGPILIFAGIMAFLVRLKLRRTIPLGPFSCVAAIFLIYTVVRLSALAYVAVYFGHFDARIIFSTYVLMMLIAPPLVADAWGALKKCRASRATIP
jgi:hypothetical protein